MNREHLHNVMIDLAAMTGDIDIDRSNQAATAAEIDQAARYIQAEQPTAWHFYGEEIAREIAGNFITIVKEGNLHATEKNSQAAG